MRKDVLEKLVKYSTSTDENIALAAIYALGEGAPSDGSVIDELLELTRHNSLEIRVAATKALGRLYRRR